LLAFTSEYTKFKALLRMVTSPSLTHSTMVRRCRCTACASAPVAPTTFASAFSATYRTLLSLSARNLPNTFTASTLKPPTDSTPTTHRTASYKTAAPAFFPAFTFDATFAKQSDIKSDASASPAPSTRSRRRSFTCKNGSCCPPTSCSAEYAP
jgi:hypothetical protein